MKYYTEVQLANGRICVISNAAETDAAELTAVRRQTSGETDFMARYPDEIPENISQVAASLQTSEESAGAVYSGDIGDWESVRHSAAVRLPFPELVAMRSWS